MRLVGDFIFLHTTFAQIENGVMYCVMSFSGVPACGNRRLSQSAPKDGWWSPNITIIPGTMLYIGNGQRLQYLLMVAVSFVLGFALTYMFGYEDEVEEAAEAPTTKECPFCKTEIHIDAVKCPNCTADLK